MPVGVDRVILTAGTSEGIELALGAMADAGDEVLVPTPTYPLYTAVLAKLGAKAVFYRTDPENRWQPDVDDIAGKITPATRAIVVIDPNNPTGAVYPEATRRALIDLADTSGVPILADEVYGDLGFDGPFRCSAASTRRTDSVVLVTVQGLRGAGLARGLARGRVVAAAERRAGGDQETGRRPPLQHRDRCNTPLTRALTGDRSHQREVRARNCVPRATSRCAAERHSRHHVRGPARGVLRHAESGSCRPVSPTKTTCSRCCAQTGILCVYGSGFGLPAADGFFRVVFLAPPDALAPSTTTSPRSPRTFALVKLSIIMPAFNERRTIRDIVDRVLAVDLPGIEKELIIVDDASSDGTRDILAEMDGNNGIRVFYQSPNQGKGAAVARGMREATGDILLMQDADLEYNPTEYPMLLRPILRGDADVVYGSRFLGSPTRSPGVVLLALGRQQDADAAVQRGDRPQPHRHGDVLQGVDARRGQPARSAVAAFRRGAGNHVQGCAAACAHLRSADFLQRPHVCRGQEDRLQGRGPGGVDHPAIRTLVPAVVSPPGMRGRPVSVAAVIMTWPLAAVIDREIAWDMGDPLFNSWVLMWTGGQVLAFLCGDFSALNRYWHGNIFYPERLTVAYSEHMAPQMLQALPVLAATDNVVLTYNLLFLSTFVLSGLGRLSAGA